MMPNSSPLPAAPSAPPRRGPSGILSNLPISRLGTILCSLLVWAASGFVSAPAAGTAPAGTPERLTSLPGHETEAAWSPDGRSIAFQYQYKGKRSIRILQLDGTSRIRTLVETEGQACYPAWSPDGKWIVYSGGHFTTTAAEAAERHIAEGFHLFRVPAAGGAPEPLSTGRYRDYTPQFDSAGRQLWFTSTRALHMTSAALYRLAWKSEAEAYPALPQPEHVFGWDGHSLGAMEPCPSPDGRYVVFVHYAGVRSLWRLWLLDVRRPSRLAALTEIDLAAYAPSWSPDGRYIACTGYRDGDPGWGLYLVDPHTGAAVRVDTGPGNSRSPAWSPDGRSLVFENNRAGSYDLYRIAAPEVSFPAVAPTAARPPREPVLRLDFRRSGAATFQDLSDRHNDAVVEGRLPRTGDGGLLFGKGNLRIPRPAGTDFGKGAFYVTVRVRVLEHTGKLRLIIVGDHPEHRLGWQVFLHPSNVLYFNGRSPGGNFMGIRTPAPLPVGKTVTVTGVRTDKGTIILIIDGREIGRQEGATMSYSRARQIRIGCQWDGSSPFEDGIIYSVEAGRGLPPEIRTHREQLRDFYRE